MMLWNCRVDFGFLDKGDRPVSQPVSQKFDSRKIFSETADGHRGGLQKI